MWVQRYEKDSKKCTFSFSLLSEREKIMKNGDSLICINKSGVCAHNFTKSHCGMQKTPYLCSVKHDKKILKIVPTNGNAASTERRAARITTIKNKNSRGATV